MSEFVTSHYRTRAEDYVRSATHATGGDLDHLIEQLTAERPARLLDLGCGGGHVSYAAAPHADLVVSCDPTQTMTSAVMAEAERRSHEQIQAACGFAEALPFADDVFDAIASRYSAHHWNDLETGLVEARRVLRPGGLGIFIDTVAPEDAMADSVLQAIEVLRDPSHMRNYRPSEWRQNLEWAGFVVEAHIPLRLRLDFASWVARTRTPALHRDAILSLQRAASPHVQHRFAFEEDGSFTLDTAFFVVR